MVIFAQLIGALWFVAPLIIAGFVIISLRYLTKTQILSSPRSVGMFIFALYYICATSTGGLYFSQLELDVFFIYPLFLMAVVGYFIFLVRAEGEITKEQNILAYIILFEFLLSIIVPEVHAIRNGGLYGGGFGMDLGFALPGLFAACIPWAFKSMKAKKYFGIALFLIVLIITIPLRTMLDQKISQVFTEQKKVEDTRMQQITQMYQEEARKEALARSMEAPEQKDARIRQQKLSYYVNYVFPSGGSYQELPQALQASPDTVMTLYLDQKFTTLPAEIYKFKNLQTLFLVGNGLTSIPPDIANFKNLQTLLVADNTLSALPEEIYRMANLREVDLIADGLTAEQKVHIQDEMRDVNGEVWGYHGFTRDITTPLNIGIIDKADPRIYK